MRKQYIKPVLEMHRVGLGSLMTDVVTLSGDGQATENSGAKERVDEEYYESESGNYGDLW